MQRIIEEWTRVSETLQLITLLSSSSSILCFLFEARKCGGGRQPVVIDVSWTWTPRHSWRMAPCPTTAPSSHTSFQIPFQISSDIFKQVLSPLPQAGKGPRRRIRCMKLIRLVSRSLSVLQGPCALVFQRHPDHTCVC